MKRVLLCVALAVVCACTPSKMMTYTSYQNVYIGDNIFDVQSYNGSPYEIRRGENSTLEYIYIERIPTAEGADLFREYTLVVQDGRVIEKRVHESMASTVQIQLQNN